MDRSESGKKRYSDMVSELSDHSNLATNCIKAFIVGGLICDLGQLLTNAMLYYGLSKDDAGMYTSVILVFLGVLLTGAGVYEKLGKFAGAGSVVPITGFANSIAAPAIEFKKEGYIMGVGAKMFIVAGPVIVYGTVASVLVGIVYWLVK